MSTEVKSADVEKEQASILHGKDSDLALKSQFPIPSTGDENAGRDEAEADDYLTGTRLYGLVSALILVVLMVTLDTSIIATALPRITDDFHTIADIGWYGSVYMIANAALQPLSGKIYTHFSLKYSFLGFVAIFELGSLVSALASSSMMLIIGRTICGIGGSGLINGAMTIVGVATPSHRRPTFIGGIMSFGAAGQVIGPLIGGALTQHASWRWCFWINLPIGGVTAAVLFLIYVPENKGKIANWTFGSFVKECDLLGFAVFAPACIMLMLALEWGGLKYSWNSATIIVLFCGAGTVYSFFVVWERRQGDSAMIPASMVSRRVIYSSCITSALLGGPLLLLSYYIPLWFQVVKHASPTMSAVDTLPTFLSQILGATVAGTSTSRIGYLTPFALLGTAFSAVGSALLSTFTLSTAVGTWIGYQIVTGLGRGLALQQPIATVQSSVSKSQIATVTAIVVWCQFTGGAIFIAVGQTLFTNVLRSALGKFAPEIDPDTVIRAGATDFMSVVPAASRHGVLLAYNQAITRSYLLAVGASCAAFFMAFGMGWKKIEKTEKKRIGATKA